MSRSFQTFLAAAEVRWKWLAGVPDVPGSSERSLEVDTVVRDVPGGSRKALNVVAGVPDVPGSSGRSLEVVAVVPDVSASAECRWKWSHWF